MSLLFYTPEFIVNSHILGQFIQFSFLADFGWLCSRRLLFLQIAHEYGHWRYCWRPVLLLCQIRHIPYNTVLTLSDLTTERTDNSRTTLLTFEKKNIFWSAVGFMLTPSPPYRTSTIQTWRIKGINSLHRINKIPRNCSMEVNLAETHLVKNTLFAETSRGKTGKL